MIFLDTNVISETLRKARSEAVLSWLIRHDAEIALPSVAIAEIAFGIQKIVPDQRSILLEQGWNDCRNRRGERRTFGDAQSLRFLYDRA